MLLVALLAAPLVGGALWQAGRRAAPADARTGVGFSPGFELLSEPVPALRRDLRAMRELGARRIRVDVSWAQVEPVEGQRDWTTVDRVVREARAAGLEVLGLLVYEPSWARRFGDAGAPLPVDPDAFAGFAAEAASRYRDDVTAWEVWNEPNTDRFWGAAPDPAAYAAVVRATSPALRAAAPEAEVVVGALAPARNLGNGATIRPETFVRDFYSALAPEERAPGVLFDALSVHPYSFPVRPTAGVPWNTFARLESIRATAEEAGGGDVEIWLTEYGAPTGASDRAVGEWRQALLVVEGLLAARRLDFTGPVYLYSYRDPRAAPQDFEANFGLVTDAGRRKPAYWALRLVLAPWWSGL
ncbi:hypothetical protein GCM10023340_04430 [Nocardioides marinquilinus]|uniref:Glycoside hydrolase family 42 N-terminal domain-containing protein n=1 Tax=Nocardioides marinquilinus TaxID=1210400 RepID=A0ABP9PAG4_9ACTN